VESFGVIYCDPPWKYSQAWSGKKVHGAAAAHYKTMSDADLAAIPLGDWASSQGAILALWTTLPRLDSGMDLLRQWGFTYKTSLPWIKTTPSTGNIQRGVGIWFMGTTELVLFGQKGKVGNFKDRRGTLGLLHNDRTFFAPGTKHSAKPHDLYEYLEAFPGPYLELFARNTRPGWVSWGLELGYELGAWGVRTVTEEFGL